MPFVDILFCYTCGSGADFQSTVTCGCRYPNIEMMGAAADGSSTFMGQWFPKNICVLSNDGSCATLGAPEDTAFSLVAEQ